MLPLQIGRHRSGAVSEGSGLTKEAEPDPQLQLQQLAGNKSATKAMEAKKSRAKVPKKMEAKDAQSAFAMLAPILNILVPSPGTSAKLEVEFRIPAKGAVITLRLMGMVAKLTESAFTLAIEAAVGAGGHIGVAMAKGEVGGFLETQGPDAKGALTLASWSLFRSLLAESAVVPQELVEGLYGTDAQSSDEWDKEIRKTYFGKDSENSAQVGKFVAGEASGGVKGVGNIKGGLQAKLGRLYNADSIERREGAKSKSQKFLGKLGIKRGAQASLGDKVVTIIASAECDVVGGIGGGTLKMTTAIRQEKDKRGGKETKKYVLDTLRCDGTIKTKLVPLTAIASYGGAGGVMATKLVALVKAAKKALSKTEDKIKKTEKEDKSVKVGDALGSLASMRDGLETALKQANSVDISIPDVVSTGQLHLVSGMEDRKLKFAVALENLMKVEIPDLVVAHAKFERTERVGSIEFDGEKWVAHFGDLEKELSLKKKKEKPSGRPRSNAFSGGTPPGAPKGGRPRSNAFSGGTRPQIGRSRSNAVSGR